MGFAEQGFVHLEQVFDLEQIAAFEDQVLDLYAMQALKIGDYRETVQRILRGDGFAWGSAGQILRSDGSTFQKLSNIVETLEGADKEALYQIQKFLPSCQALRKLFSQEFMDRCADLIGSDPKTTLLDGPALFVNRPNTQRLLYKWHSEAHYYPVRRRFLNVWLPVFSGRTKENGAMSVLPKSHVKHFPFAEYTGYNKDTENKKNHFLQFEIPENFLVDYHEHVCASKRGDAILFERNMVHRSNHNTSPEYSFAIVARVWDPSDDLTLSGNLAATPYGGDIGRANLVVRP